MSREAEYDVVVIGGGLGGLICGALLSRYGKRVVVLEKNHQIGGNLQVFSRDKVIFDTGVHYIGALAEGNNLDRFFKFLGIREGLNLVRMDVDAADRIHFGNEDKFYPIAQGYDNFSKQLTTVFPESKAEIEGYCRLIQDVCSAFPLYNLRYDQADYFSSDFFTTSLQEVLEKTISNKRLREVLTGNSLLYGANAEITPFYVHALVVDGYIRSAHRCVRGSSQIAKLLVKNIRENGGEVLKRAEVEKCEIEQGRVAAVCLTDGRRIKGLDFISSLHPKASIRLVGEANFRKAFVSRITTLTDTQSAFSVHIKFKPGSFPYLNYNIYHHKTPEGVWKAKGKVDESWPCTLMVSMTVPDTDSNYAEAASVLTYMDYAEVKPWETSFNTVALPGERPDSYYLFKKRCEERVLDELEVVFPEIREKIESVYSSTPLTYKNYIGDLTGSMYGIQKNADNPVATMVDPRTKIPNFFLTGQSINLHGIIGVTVSAFATCMHLIDGKTLIEDLNRIN